MYLFCLLTSMFAPQMYHASGAVGKDGPLGATGRSCVSFGAPRKKPPRLSRGGRYINYMLKALLLFGLLLDGQNATNSTH